ncbi:tRNA pseudouridine(55) synthase TruB [Thermoactinomyces daqus]|uniref:tRNA pseudouridine synthase B n=1 Tax=Thermoactinomyces daqus TaxID=1329516 RepID=A0A7W1X929_9BACL|nr:tRNA pseudouridine(55) synthase TruB [Thermoactinomyces daqus]MBA4542303.1 tRNA pseudouridine(55) synthase TruB [Thermoactinomyces daqus]
MTCHGILPVFKPKGLTSHDVVAKVRRLAGQKKVGHTGTLDPEVEGVLPVCLGQATRIAEYIQAMPKRYRGSFMVGISTDTEDQTGEITAKADSVEKLDHPCVEAIFSRFTGEIEQVPPMYSAVKIKGKKLYELAREGKEIERPSRKVFIYELHLLGIEDTPYPKISFDVLCSKGTYVRTLCVDLGRALGYPAHMTGLVRTQSGPFHLEDCWMLEELAQAAEQQKLGEYLVSPGDALSLWPSLVVGDEDVKRVLDGWELRFSGLPASGSLVRVYSESGRFCALYRVMPGGLAKPEKVFREVEC